MSNTDYLQWQSLVAGLDSCFHQLTGCEDLLNAGHGYIRPSNASLSISYVLPG